MLTTTALQGCDHLKCPERRASILAVDDASPLSGSDAAVLIYNFT
jgi:hypothetical protein